MLTLVYRMKIKQTTARVSILHPPAEEPFRKSGPGQDSYNLCSLIENPQYKNIAAMRYATFLYCSRPCPRGAFALVTRIVMKPSEFVAHKAFLTIHPCHISTLLERPKSDKEVRALVMPASSAREVYNHEFTKDYS